MAIIRYKMRSLIRRFGSEPVNISDALAKQYTDRGQAVYVKERMTEIEETPEEETPEEETPEEETVGEDQEVEEDTIKVKIKNPSKEKEK